MIAIAPAIYPEEADRNIPARLPVRIRRTRLFSHPVVIHVIAGMRRDALHLRRVAVEVVGDRKADHAAIFGNHFLALAIDFLALVVVELDAGFCHERVEFGTFQLESFQSEAEP